MKPRTYGVCWNVRPVDIQPETLIYQLHERNLQAVDDQYWGQEFREDLERGLFIQVRKDESSTEHDD